VPRLRLSLTISGAARFGPFEGGALAALIVAARALGQETLVIDSVASATVGSINDLLTARSLLGGVDPITLFDAVWMQKAHLEDPAAAMLGVDGLPSGPVTARQSEPVRLSMALSNIDSLMSDRGGPVPGSREAVLPDWYSLEMTQAATPRDFLALIHAASSPASNADLSWYFDAATAGDEPLARTIDLAEDIASDDERLYLVVDPDATRPSIRPSVYDDLTRLESARSRIEWMERVVPTVSVEALDVLRCQGDVVAEARRIMTERQADRSNDYATLLDSLVQSAHNPENSGSSRPDTVESRQEEFGLGYRTMSSWLEHRLHVYLTQIDLSPMFDRLNQESGRLGGRSSPGEELASSAQSLRGMAALGH
jgi:hypothetical protein